MRLDLPSHFGYIRISDACHSKNTFENMYLLVWATHFYFSSFKLFCRRQFCVAIHHHNQIDSKIASIMQQTMGKNSGENREKKCQKREEKEAMKAAKKQKKSDKRETKKKALKAAKKEEKSEKRKAKMALKAASAGSYSSSEHEMTESIANKDQRHVFQVNSLDHCESPRIAYEHIQPVLNELAKYANTKDVQIWDPFYCDGTVKSHLESFGFQNVHHKNEDFYAVVKSNKLPPHDVFLTNPPYSDDHIERLLKFLSTKEQPFCLLMPNWVARKKDYSNLMPKGLFYLSPIEPYCYVMPEWNERPEHVEQDGKTTPYLSSWYIHAGGRTDELMDKMNSLSKWNSKWVVAKTIKGLKWKIQKLRK
jgi:hypothetical protein